jgi:hypothetical protein
LARKGPHVSPLLVLTTDEGHSTPQEPAMQCLKGHDSCDKTADGTRPTHRSAQVVMPRGQAATHCSRAWHDGSSAQFLASVAHFWSMQVPHS